MKLEDYKYTLINNINIAYTDSGSGRPIVFVHGFASFSYTWFKLIENLPQNYRFVTLDLKGFGYSEKICDDNLSPFDQSIIVKEFISKLSLTDIILVGHSMGGEISVLSLFDEEFRKIVSALILIDSAGLFERMPGFVEEISAFSPSNPMLKIVDDRNLALYVLLQIFYDKDKITEETLLEYSKLLSFENYRNCLISAAKHIGIANEKFFRQKIQQLQIPSLVIWGEEDEVINVTDSYIFRDDLKAELVIFPECGHSPQEEMPTETTAV
ncbi:MAG: alpha/beta hydrolase, partial [Lentisphaerota bacterium]